jgi:hypothetical protein
MNWDELQWSETTAETHRVDLESAAIVVFKDPIFGDANKDRPWRANFLERVEAARGTYLPAFRFGVILGAPDLAGAKLEALSVIGLRLSGLVSEVAMASIFLKKPHRSEP